MRLTSVGHCSLEMSCTHARCRSRNSKLNKYLVSKINYKLARTVLYFNSPHWPPPPSKRTPSFTCRLNFNQERLMKCQILSRSSRTSDYVLVSLLTPTVGESRFHFKRFGFQSVRRSCLLKHVLELLSCSNYFVQVLF